MNRPTIRVDVDPNEPPPEDRFDRFRLIGWWDQERLRGAKALVVGAGALGNELVKNLALLGWGRVLIADMDRIENSNLSRSVLYREQDNGGLKADVAARAARDIYPDMAVHAFNGNVVHDLGLGVYRWADVVFGGLDNREARLSINRNCYKVDRPWIDGAIEQIQGVARMFAPDGPCYECTMSERDWDQLRRRRSCNLLSRSEMEQGKTPTTPTISSIIAGVQCQEGVKRLHGIDTLAGRGFVFEGLSGESYTIEYQRKEDCYSHEPLDDVVELGGVDDMTVGDVLAEARRPLGPDAVLEIAREVLEKLVCPKCGEEEAMFVSLGAVGAEKAYCPRCEGVRREVVTFYKIDDEKIGNADGLSDRTMRGVGVPPFDIVFARSGERLIGLEFTGDASEVLGPLWEAPPNDEAAGEEAIEWL